MMDKCERTDDCAMGEHTDSCRNADILLADFHEANQALIDIGLALEEGNIEGVFNMMDVTFTREIRDKMFNETEI